MGRRLWLTAVVAAAAFMAMGGGVARAAICDPLDTKPIYDQPVPTETQVLGHKLTHLKVDQIYAYMQAVDDASDRVVTGTYGTSWNGAPLRYALVSDPKNLSPFALNALSHDAQRLRDPRLPEDAALKIEARIPAILSIGANVHGNEPSGSEATLRTLYELAARSDCAATQVLDNAVVLLIPTQNPDGRTLNRRRNAYFFDLNRDDWARTQPETDARIELFRKYPPLLFADEHENGTSSYFFPPTSDPVYHEVPDNTLAWVDHLYGPALADAFTRKGFGYYTGTTAPYDFLAPEYGDTVVSDGFLGAGMTFEKGYRDGYPVRVRQHWVSQWVALAAGATRRASLVTEWHDGYVEAYHQGQQGVLQPNFLENPALTLYQQVPDRLVRNYFLLNDPSKQRDLHILVRRLQRMDVDVYQLTKPLFVPDLHPYGGTDEAVTLPAGSYWVPMAQGQKHWIQAMMNEDSYISYPLTYDTTAWSQPEMLNLDGGSSGVVLHPRATRVPQLGDTPPQDLHGVRVAEFRLGTNFTGSVSSGWLTWVLDHDWQIPYQKLLPADIKNGALDNVDVLLVPDGAAHIAYTELGPAGRAALRQWVQNGGRFIGWFGGIDFARRMDISQVHTFYPPASEPGALYHTDINQSSPLSAGIGEHSWVYNLGDQVLVPHGGTVVESYPPLHSQDWFRSGYAKRDAQYGGSAIVVDEPYGDGHVITFGTEPTLRGFTQSSMDILWNAITIPE